MKPTDKQYLIFVDVSVSMDFGDTAGMARVPPLAAAAAVVYALRRTETNRPPIVAAFSPGADGPTAKTLDIAGQTPQPTYKEVYTLLKSVSNRWERGGIFLVSELLFSFKSRICYFMSF
jgi:hypothetical protein